MKRSSIRLMEMVRIGVSAGGIIRFDRAEVYQELARRGILCRLQHFERYDGMVKPTDTAKIIISQTQEMGLDLGIFQRFRPGDVSYSRFVAVTRVGKLTLENWDDVTADGIYD